MLGFLSGKFYCATALGLKQGWGELGRKYYIFLSKQRYQVLDACVQVTFTLGAYKVVRYLWKEVVCNTCQVGTFLGNNIW